MSVACLYLWNLNKVFNASLSFFKDEGNRQQGIYEKVVDKEREHRLETLTRKKSLLKRLINRGKRNFRKLFDILNKIYEYVASLKKAEMKKKNKNSR